MKDVFQLGNKTVISFGQRGHLLEALGRAVSRNNMFSTFIIMMSVFETDKNMSTLGML